MRRILDAPAFAAWLARVLPGFADARPPSLFSPRRSPIAATPQLVHLDGLNLSRAWCFRGIAAALRRWRSAPRRRCHAAADAHLAAGLARASPATISSARTGSRPSPALALDG